MILPPLEKPLLKMSNAALIKCPTTTSNKEPRDRGCGLGLDTWAALIIQGAVECVVCLSEYQMGHIIHVHIQCIVSCRQQFVCLHVRIHLYFHRPVIDQ